MENTFFHLYGPVRTTDNAHRNVWGGGIVLLSRPEDRIRILPYTTTSDTYTPDSSRPSKPHDVNYAGGSDPNAGFGTSSVLPRVWFNAIKIRRINTRHSDNRIHAPTPEDYSGSIDRPQE